MLTRNPLVVPQDKLLFVGTTEKIAKLAPLKGLEPPNYLTNLYPGVFCRDCGDMKWGIISVDTSVLFPDMMSPFKSSARNKRKWKLSLDKYHVCIYHGRIPAAAIVKVMTYNPKSNDFITKTILEQNPEKKDNYEKNLTILKWLNGEDMNLEDIYPDKINYKIISDIGEKIVNRTGLDVYYIKNTEQKRSQRLRT